MMAKGTRKNKASKRKPGHVSKSGITVTGRIHIGRRTVKRAGFGLVCVALIFQPFLPHQQPMREPTYCEYTEQGSPVCVEGVKRP